MKTPPIPQFLFSPDEKSGELYITCTDPLALIWVRQTVPDQLYIIEGPQDENLLRAAADWYRQKANNSLNKN